MKNIVIVLDSSVIIFLLLHALEKKFGKLEEMSLEEQENVCKITLLSLNWINNMYWFKSTPMKNFTPIWVIDSKPYWRSDYYAQYKADRKSKPCLFGNILQLVKDNFNWLGMPGYEADDVAAGIVKVLQSHKIPSLVVTSDSDWMGMVSPLTTWINPCEHFPRIRNRTEVYCWIQKKALKCPKYHLPEFDKFEPKDLWDFKLQEGDRTDHIPANRNADTDGQFKEIINLFEPPIKHRLWNSQVFREQLAILLTNKKAVPTLKQKHQLLAVFREIEFLPLSPITDQDIPDYLRGII